MKFIIEQRIDIAAPAELVWQVLSDLPRYGEWNPFCIECRSSLRPGEPIDMKVKLMRRPQTQREWMLRYEAGRGFAYQMKPVPLGALSSLRFHELQVLDAQRTRYRSYFHLQGWLKPLVLALFRRQLQEGFTGMTQALRQRAEALWQQQQAR